MFSSPRTPLQTVASQDVGISPPLCPYPFTCPTSCCRSKCPLFFCSVVALGYIAARAYVLSSQKNDCIVFSCRSQMFTTWISDRRLDHTCKVFSWLQKLHVFCSLLNGSNITVTVSQLRYNRPFVVLSSILFVFLFYPLALVHSYYVLLALFCVRENWAGGKEKTLKEHYTVFLP